MTKAELYSMVQRIKDAWDITESSYPIDMFELCNHIYGIAAARTMFKTPKLRGMIHIAKDNTENNVIIINSNKSPAEQNYHCAHEFMHIFSDSSEKGTILTYCDPVKPNQNSYNEWFANEGAAEFLVPYKYLLPLVKENYGTMLQGFGTFSFCQDYADRFNVSPVVLENRLRSLKYEIYQYLNGVSIDNVKIMSENEQKRRNIQVKSLIEMEDERFQSHFNYNKTLAV